MKILNISRLFFISALVLGLFVALAATAPQSILLSNPGNAIGGCWNIGGPCHVAPLKNCQDHPTISGCTGWYADECGLYVGEDTDKECVTIGAYCDGPSPCEVIPYAVCMDVI